MIRATDHDISFEKPWSIPLNLHFFDEGEKTETATPRKRRKAREEGQVAKSQEVSTAFLLVAVFFFIEILFLVHVWQDAKRV